jgi:cyclase
MALLACCVALAAAGAASADGVKTTELRVSEPAPGVHTIRHPDPTDDFPDGNTTLIVGTRHALVVDTGYLPSTARRDIEIVRGLTDRPVRYVLNTHWHNDHVGGNAAWLDAFPSADIVAHAETRAMMDARIRSYVGRFIAEDSAIGRERARRQRQLDEGIGDDGQPLRPAEREAAILSLARSRRAVAEFAAFVYQPPTLTFSGELTLDLGGREVRLLHLGRGNTGGDVVAYLPHERVLVAGDLLTHPVPYAFGGYPGEWRRTLQAVAQLDIDVIVPGHGEVLRGKQHLLRVIDLLGSAIDQVTELVNRHGSAATLDEVTRRVDLARFRQAMTRDDDDREFFDASMAGLIRQVYAEVKAR